MKTLHSKNWFLERIGKRVWRDKNKPPCGCNTCNEVEENGMIIGDELHADYMFHTQNEFANEGHYLNYRDEKDNSHNY